MTSSRESEANCSSSQAPTSKCVEFHLPFLVVRWHPSTMSRCVKSSSFMCRRILAYHRGAKLTQSRYEDEEQTRNTLLGVELGRWRGKEFKQCRAPSTYIQRRAVFEVPNERKTAAAALSVIEFQFDTWDYDGNEHNKNCNRPALSLFMLRIALNSHYFNDDRRVGWAPPRITGE